MTSPLIDVHVHLSESKAIGAWSKAAYEIWEYGAKDDVPFGPASGDGDDLRDAMRAGGLDHAVVVNAFSVDEWRGAGWRPVRRRAGGDPRPERVEDPAPAELRHAGGACRRRTVQLPV